MTAVPPTSSPPRDDSSAEPLASMTGFARHDGGDERMTWTWELKSVNGRNLDMRFRLPSGYETLEPRARAAVARSCRRGNVQIALAVHRGETATMLQVNRAFLDQLIPLSKELQERLGATPPRADALLSVRGVVEAVEPEDSPEETAQRLEHMAADFELAVAALVGMRRGEGARLGDVARGQLDAIATLVEQAADSAAAQPEALRERLRQQVAELLEATPSLPEERLAQEAALLITKADVREELDRLKAHIDAARDLLTAGGAVGRKLDFLCQEFNREVNTLCSKSSDVGLTRIGLDLKSVVEQLREQIQNIE